VVWKCIDYNLTTIIVCESAYGNKQECKSQDEFSLKCRGSCIHVHCTNSLMKYSNFPFQEEFKNSSQIIKNGNLNVLKWYESVLIILNMNYWNYDKLITHSLCLHILWPIRLLLFIMLYTTDVLNCFISYCLYLLAEVVIYHNFNNSYSI
jgi:hypothetical protein